LGRKGSRAGDNAPSTQARLAIADALCIEVRRWRVSQEKAAARLGIQRTVLNRLLNGDLSRFALGNLIDLAAAAGVEVKLIIHDPAEAALVTYAPPVAGAGLFDWSPCDRAKQLYADARRVERHYVD